MQVLFSPLYDINALAIVHTLLLGFVTMTGLATALDGAHREQVRDVLGLTVLATGVRLALNSAGLIRVAHATINLDLTLPTQYYYGYPLSLNGLTAAIRPFAPATVQEFDLVLGIIFVLGSLTPALFYLLTRILGSDRRLAWVIGLLVVLNPTHILYSTNYDFFVPSVFFELLAHTLLILFLRSGSWVQFGGFFVASAAFYHARPENSAVFYFHLACLLYAVAKLPLPRARTLGLTMAFAAFHLAYHVDWMRNADPGNNDVVQHLWMAPVRLLAKLFDPAWNHLIDWPWSPPYLVVLVVLGMWRAARKPSAIHLYAVVVMGAMMAVYHELMVPSPWHNARFFLNFLPATAIFALTALEWLQARWPRTWQVALVTVVLLFVPYVPKLAAFDTIQSQEFAFFRHQVLPTLALSADRPTTVWHQPITAAQFTGVPAEDWGLETPFDDAGAAREFEESHLDRPGLIYTTDHQAVPAGGWVFLGASCYQFSAIPRQMTPECEAQLHDPRNRLVLTSPPHRPAPNHQVTPWARAGRWKSFDAVRFYLLRRT